MNIDQALLVVEEAIKPNYLNRTQELVLRHTLAGKTYSEIATEHNYDMEYIKYVGCELWRLLSKSFGEPVNKSNFPNYIKHCVRNNADHSKNIEHQSQLTESDSGFYFDWGTAPDVSNFKGRTEELEQLKKWTLDKDCHLVSLLGPVGIGKTALATSFGEQYREHFQFILWRSLHNPLPLGKFLNSLLNTLPMEKGGIPEMTIEDKMLQLLNFLRQHRCLLILDGWETLLEAGISPSHYYPSYQEYDRFLQLLASSRHQSLVLVTSSQKPFGLGPYEEDTAQTMILNGLSSATLQEIFRPSFPNWESDEDWQLLFERYSYNPKLIKTVITTIQEVFHGNWAVIRDSNFICQEIHLFLKSEFERLPKLEKEILCWLLIDRFVGTSTQLRSNLVQSASYTRFLEALVCLQQRGWIEKNEDCYVLKFVSINFLTYQVVKSFIGEKG
ncbi:hypothetical protein FRE64_03785 [Euhalothece natronophila Z-M001]|uniref:Uncharacterized protein n=1 Tax=Euhalothece natronophila Z-M001 TaxID=522448 RepID=A0A5B8NIR4_9CHRO|nr:NB-ARC domain-containing protein [Euhalothece natronophila]QDZ39133.1 hypothetical protein FRE64_03785 [Euhalothece natronophila Z-M001]